MSHHGLAMSLGSSGRIVLEIDPGLKREIYACLTRNGLTMKDWFLRTAQAQLLSKVDAAGRERRHTTTTGRRAKHSK